ncbi:5'-nucleotidase domain-containing protein 1, partial [Pseudolycoriella hygida]
MTGTDLFKVSDYDYVGFDLDNTLLQYKVSAMVDLEYRTLSNFMVNMKGYSDKYLLQPLDVDFLQKGLIVDIHRGNLLKISCDGVILKATHGSTLQIESAEEVAGGMRFGNEGIFVSLNSSNEITKKILENPQMVFFRLEIQGHPNI